MNRSIIEYIQKEIDENKLSHAFLIETNNPNSLVDEIFNLFVKNGLIQTGNIENNVSTYVISPENNLIDKNKILELQKFIGTKSTVSEYKIYFIVMADLMNLSSSNKLLKVLEEPAENIVGFLITSDEHKIIPTIKSRCKRFKYNYKNEVDSEGIEIINQLINIQILKFADIIDLKKQLLVMEKAQILKILSEFQSQLNNNLTASQNPEVLAKQYKILDNIIDLIQSNVNVELCLDKMFIEMRK